MWEQQPRPTTFERKGQQSMNWKSEAIEKLKKYEAHRRALENIPQEIKRLESAYAGIRSAVTDGTPVSGGSNTREDAMLSNITHRDELKRRLKEARLWVRIVDNALAVLDDSERKVLDRFYINRKKGNVDKLCEELGRERSAIYARRDAALRHFTIALYGITES